MKVSFVTLVTTSDVVVPWVSKNPSSCLNTAFKYFMRIRDACLSPVLVQQNASDKKNAKRSISDI